MKLRSRRRRDKMKLWNRVGRGQSVTSLHSALSIPAFSPHHSILSPSTQPHHLLRSSLSAATCRQAVAPAILAPAVFLLPFLLHKITGAAERGSCVVPSLLAQLVGPAVAGAQLARRPVAACPSPFFSLSPGPNGGPFAAGGAIGKQRPKMRFPVSFSSLTNK